MRTKIEEAIYFVFKAFKGKKRIKDDIDMAYHSITVGMMLKDLGMSTEIVLTGLLHDIIEDTNYGYKDICEKFGKKVADNVLCLSENRDIKNFEERKLEFIQRLQSVDNDLIIVEIADKLQNLISDYDLFLKDGVSALKTLNVTYDMNKWYYSSMKELFVKKIDKCILLDRYLEMVKIYFEI